MHEEYFIKDHLGNVLVRFEDMDKDGSIRYDMPVEGEDVDSELIASHHYYSRRDLVPAISVALTRPRIRQWEGGMRWIRWRMLLII